MRISGKLVCAAALFCCAVCAIAQEQKLTAQDIVTRHLDSIGPAAARAAIKSRTTQATTQFDVVLGSPAGHAQGSALFVALDRRLSFAMRYPEGKYPDEQFVFDGKSVQVALGNTRQRSALGDFFYRHNLLMSEGLFGGVLRTSWPLLELKDRQPKLKYNGLKKVDGRELHDLTYAPRQGADQDLIIHLYFEPDTYRHVKSVYTFTVERSLRHQAELSRRDVFSGPQNREDIRYKVEESFSDFRAVDGLTLPGRWKLTYTAESGGTMSSAWEFTLGPVAHNNVTE